MNIMPSQKEQDKVVWYVLKRPLERPKTTYAKVILYYFLYCSINIVIIISLYCMFKRFGIYFLSFEKVDYYLVHYVKLIVYLSLLVFSVSGFLFRKKAIIGIIHLYQHYAPEQVRRRCLCKPTCSEYAILVVEEYGVIRGGYKIYIRLFKTCRGRIYKIDEP